MATVAETQYQKLKEAIDYAMACGCFFPVPEPSPSAPVRAWVQWGAMRHFHDVVAESFRHKP